MEAIILLAVLAGGYVVYRSVQNGKKHEQAALDGATRRAQEAAAPYKIEPPSLQQGEWPFPTGVGVAVEGAGLVEPPKPKPKAVPAKSTAAKKAPAKKNTAVKKTAATKTAAKKAPAKKTKSTK